MDGAEGLLMGLHGSALRMLSDASEIHFQGLGMAARMARKQGKISARMCKKLVDVATAYNLVRHVTRMSCKELLSDVASELQDSTTTAEPDDPEDSTEILEPTAKKVKTKKKCLVVFLQPCLVLPAYESF